MGNLFSTLLGSTDLTQKAKKFTMIQNTEAKQRTAGSVLFNYTNAAMAAGNSLTIGFGTWVFATDQRIARVYCSAVKTTAAGVQGNIAMRLQILGIRLGVQPYDYAAGLSAGATLGNGSISWFAPSGQCIEDEPNAGDNSLRFNANYGSLVQLTIYGPFALNDVVNVDGYITVE